MKNERLFKIQLKLEIEKLYVAIDKLKTDYQLELFELKNKIRQLREKIKAGQIEENIKMSIEKATDNLEEQFKNVIDVLEEDDKKIIDE
jgi:hypothetical protein